MEHSFDIKIAKKCGIPAAILYRHFQFWIKKNKANGHNQQDGRTWTYNSLRALADLFPYLSVWDVRHAVDTLIQKGVLRKGNYNLREKDRTAWYAFEDEKTALEGLPSHLWNSHKARKSHTTARKSHTALPNPIPDTIPDKSKSVEVSAQKILELDLKIQQELNFFWEQILMIFHLNKREKQTFANIAKYLVTECQAGRLQISVFKDAIEWARQAKASNASNKKGLFVSKVKEQTGFRAQKQMLQHSEKG